MTAEVALTRWSRASTRAPRLLCLHHAGGSGVFFARWAEDLAGDAEVWTASLPGRGTQVGEAQITDPDVLVAGLAQAARELLDRPLTVFGHSMGALIGFEVARKLRPEGAPLAALVLSGCKAAHLHLGQGRGPHSDAELIEGLESWGGTPPELLADPQFLSMALPPLRADLMLCDAYRYRPGAPLDIPLTTLAATRDRTAPECDVAAWSVHSTRWRGIHVLPGGHFYLLPARRLVLDVVLSAARYGLQLLEQQPVERS
jgi:surfactin synthase thioesterase subunit